MEIQCPNCNAVYNVSESKIPAEGTYTKCPKCEQRFFAERPSGVLKTQNDKSKEQVEMIDATWVRKLEPSEVERLSHNTGRATGPKKARLPYIVFGVNLCLVATAVMFLYLNQPDFDEGVAALRNHDYATAIKIFKTLAEQGDADAQSNLGVLYYKGQGVPKDYKEAARWFRKTAEQGQADAQFNLGLMYYKGQGVPKDYVTAYMWYNLAAQDSGLSESAGEIRDALASMMSSAQIARAQQMSREWSRKQKAKIKPFPDRLQMVPVD